MPISAEYLYEFLEEKADLYNRPGFIETDPVSIPRQFSKKEDIEISAFLAATIAWGQRPTIIKNANQLIKWMDNSPHDFILNAGSRELERFKKFKHRTFNGTDCVYFLKSLRHIYKKHGGMERAFSPSPIPPPIGEVPIAKQDEIKTAIANFRQVFFDLPHPTRTGKHVSNPADGSAAKRINLFLKWMVRKDKRGVDFGLWSRISPSVLQCPLDIHSGRVARKLGLLQRKQNDWKAVEELTAKLRQFDPKDPVKYDFALFGLGVFEKLVRPA